MIVAPNWADGLPITGKPWQRTRFLKSSAQIEPLIEPPASAEITIQSEIEPMRDDDPPWSDPNYKRSKASGGGTAEREHIYQDEHGKPYLKVVIRRDRAGKKHCPQYHRLGDHWVKGAPHPKIPYRLPELLAAPADAPIHIPEGEKDCDTLAALGFVATTNPEGARKGSWSVDFDKYFAGRKRVFIPEDNDDTGRASAREKAKALEGVVPDIRIVSFPDVAEHGDVTDWLNARHTKAEYLARCEVAPKWEPAHLESICAADVKMKAVAWLWPNRFAFRKLGISAGLPDEGKGQLINYVAAMITTHGGWPVNEGTAPFGNVMYLQAEDDPEDTVVPRLKAAGADLTKIHFIDMVKDEGRRRMFSLQADLDHLRKKIDAVGNVKLVLIDPASAYMGVGKIDSYRATDVRAVLGPVKQLAEELGIAIIGVMHFNKKVDITNALLRISDSLAYGAAARHVYSAIDDRENERKLLVRAKNNLVRGDRGGTLAYRFDEKNVGTDDETGEPIYAPYIKFDPAYVDITATEAMSAAAENRSPGVRGSDGVPRSAVRRRQVGGREGDRSDGEGGGHRHENPAPSQKGAQDQIEASGGQMGVGAGRVDGQGEKGGHVAI
jgi:putative DNA primase/helicase